MKRFPQKPIQFIEAEMETNLGKGNIIFVGSSTDMWANSVPTSEIIEVLVHCNMYPWNRYLFQSKNPTRFLKYLVIMPRDFILGTTLESNRNWNGSKAPQPPERYYIFKGIQARKMVSIEPIMDFDLDVFVEWIRLIAPEFVSIGADSKGHNLPEPSPEKVRALIEELKKITDVRIKDNLQRLLRSRD